MPRPSKMKPGKFYTVEYDGQKLRRVRTTYTKYGSPGDEMSLSFDKTDLFLFIEAKCVLEIQELMKDRPPWIYEKDEKLFHFLKGTESFWFIKQSIRKMQEVKS